MLLHRDAFHLPGPLICSLLFGAIQGQRLRALGPAMSASGPVGLPESRQQIREPAKASGTGTGISTGTGAGAPPQQRQTPQKNFQGSNNPRQVRFRPVNKHKNLLLHNERDLKNPILHIKLLTRYIKPSCCSKNCINNTCVLPNEAFEPNTPPTPAEALRIQAMQGRKGKAARAAADRCRLSSSPGSLLQRRASQHRPAALKALTVGAINIDRLLRNA